MCGQEVDSPEAGVIVKTAKDGCAEGLVYGGGGKEGIFIKEVVPESPASKSLKVKEGKLSAGNEATAEFTLNVFSFLSFLYIFFHITVLRNVGLMIPLTLTLEVTVQILKFEINIHERNQVSNCKQKDH